MTGVLDIDFQILFYMVVGLFGLVGFFRGWWREAITSGLLVFLLLLLERPDIAKSIIDTINDLIQSVGNTATFSAAGAVDAPTTLDPATSQIYIIALIVMIALSYFIGGQAIGDTAVTAGGRIFGGILGFINGFITLSLAREYILGRYLPDSVVSAAAVAPNEITLTVSNVPQTSITDGLTIWVFIIGGGILLLSTIGTRYKVNRGEVKKQAPPGYRAS